MRHTPVMTFVNKMDCEAREPIDIIDEVEEVLKIKCAPITWPIGMGKSFCGIYHLLEDRIYLFGEKNSTDELETIDILRIQCDDKPGKSLSKFVKRSS